MPDLSLEIALQANGYLRIAGIDEAGRGPLAGPVAAAAVILPKNFTCPGLDDSKKISPKMRDRLYERLTNDPEIYWAVATAESPDGGVAVLSTTRSTESTSSERLTSRCGAPPRLSYQYPLTV